MNAFGLNLTKLDHVRASEQQTKNDLQLKICFVAIDRCGMLSCPKRKDVQITFDRYG